MDPKWRVSDLLDFEYMLKQDTQVEPESGPTATVFPDREIYLSYAKSHTPPFSRRKLLKYWLDIKRENKKKASGAPAVFPGDVFAKTMRLFRGTAILVSLITGTAISWSVLSYRGTEPINIFTCLSVFIFPQMLLLAFLCLAALLHRAGLSKTANSLYPLVSGLMRHLSLRFSRTVEQSLPGNQWSRITAIFGLLGQKRTLYGSVFYWPVFILAQVFGVFYNIGILTATLIKLTITDLAFGWQSTLSPDPETVYRLIHAFSLPWVWVTDLFAAHPTVEQIQGSKIVLKEGVEHLATGDLVSWWPFLCFSILVYGLLPRLILFIAGLYRQRRSLNQVDFTHSACDRLLMRMQTPHMEAGNRDFSAYQTTRDTITSAEKPMTEPPVNAIDALGNAIVCIPEEIDIRVTDDTLNERITHFLKLILLNRVRFIMDPASDIDALEKIIDRTGISLPSTRIVLLQEAWQPPIKETISWLKAFRKAIGEKTGFIVALIGKPSKSTIFTSPDNPDRIIWEQALDKLGDPYLRVENLGG